MMRIAVAYKEGLVCQHFSKTKAFKIYDVKEETILGSQILEVGEISHGGLADLLKHEDVDLLICGGLGAGAQNALMNAGILFRGGIAGEADRAVQAFLEGTLGGTDKACCKHHKDDEGHHHHCGHHHDGKGGHHGHHLHGCGCGCGKHH